MSRKILVAGPPLAAAAMAVASELGATVRSMDAYADPGQIAQVAAEMQPEAIIVRMGKITEEIIAASKALKVIVKHGVGYDGIDVAAATRRSIPVLIARGANSQAVAELALALMFSVARSTAWLDNRIRAGNWDKASHTGVELFGKNLGLVGMGSIGKALLAMVAPLQMPVRVFDPFMTSSPANVTLCRTLDELLEASDIVSLHCPLTPENRHMIGARELALMGPSSFLINTARGGLIDEAALYAALSNKVIRGAALDTFETEPLSPQSPLRSLDNIVLSPHVGANTFEARENVGVLALNLIFDALEGRKPVADFVVNPESMAR